jgi:hypothetical protein
MSNILRGRRDNSRRYASVGRTCVDNVGVVGQQSKNKTSVSFMPIFFLFLSLFVNYYFFKS